MILVDTGPLVASINERDTHHVRCAELLETRADELVVPAPVVIEVCQLLLSRRGTRSESLFLSAVGGGELRVVDPLPADYARSAPLVQRYADLPLGGVDALVIGIAERLGISGSPRSRRSTGGTSRSSGRATSTPSPCFRTEPAPPGTTRTARRAG